MIPLKSEKELEMLRKSGKILAGILKRLQENIRLGMTSLELDSIAEGLISENKVSPAFKGYKGYPCATCISVNEEIVHGIPGPRRLEDGDIVSIDVGIQYEGYFADAAVTLPIGKVSSQKKKLIEVTKKALLEGIKKAQPQNKLFDISSSIQKYVERHGFSVVRQFVGHGIGVSLHEEPEIPNFGKANEGPVLKGGMVLAIEPMVNAGTWESEILSNGWTAVTKDRLPSAHFEHTVAITLAGPEILTN